MNNMSKKLVLSSVLFSALAVNSIAFGGWWPETPEEKIAREKSQQEQKAIQEKAQAEQEQKAAQQKRIANLTGAVAVALAYEKEMQQRFGDESHDGAGPVDTNVFGSAEVTHLRSKALAVAQGEEQADHAALDLAFAGAHKTCSKSGARQTVPCFEVLQVLYGALSGNPVINSSLDLAKEPAAVTLEETRRRAIAKLLDGKAVSQAAREQLTQALEKSHVLPVVDDADPVAESIRKDLEELKKLAAQRKEKAQFWRSIIGTVDFTGIAGSAGDK